jgi:hypothetical protein
MAQENAPITKYMQCFSIEEAKALQHEIRKLDGWMAFVIPAWPVGANPLEKRYFVKVYRWREPNATGVHFLSNREQWAQVRGSIDQENGAASNVDTTHSGT